MQHCFLNDAFKKGKLEIKVKIYFIYYLGIVLFFTSYLPSSGQNSVNRVFLSTLKARPMSMAGAYTAVQDPFNSVDYNPATLSAINNRQGVRYSIYLNGSGLLAAGLMTKDLTHWDLLFGLGIKGFTLSKGRVSFAMTFGEESLSNKKLGNYKDFSIQSYRRYRHSSAGFSLNFAANVSIGAAVETGYYSLLSDNDGENDREWEWGYRYGIYVKTMHNVALGLCFVNYPGAIEKERLLLDRFSNESLNLGIAWHVRSNLMISCDVRNVSDEDQDTFTEPHAGVEWMPFSIIKIRSGAAWGTDGRSMKSFGIGLFPFINEDPSRPYLQSRVTLDVSLLQMMEKGLTENWIFASLLIRIG